MPETDPRFQPRPGRKLATRNFAQDLARLSGMDVPDTNSFNLAGADGDFLPRVDVGVPGGIRLPSVSSGPAAQRLVEVALAHARNPATRPTRLYNPGGPTVACASFVCSMLQQVDLLPRGSLDALGKERTNARWCPNLPVLFAQNGAVQILPRDTPLIDSYIQRLEPGDIILFHSPGVRFRHTGIYAGNGLMVDTSSSETELKHRPVRYLAGSYSRFAAFRFSR